MPELPDIVVYQEALATRVVGCTLERIRLFSPFLLRSVAPPLVAAEGKRVNAVRNIGKRIVLALDGELFLVLHLMIAGRLRWLARGAKLPGRITLAVLEFNSGWVAFTEAGTKRRASLHLVEGAKSLAQFDAGGLDPLNMSLEEFSERLARENHTLKRALTDPRLFSGIGNAYSDEILHRARLSPLALSARLDNEEVARLHAAIAPTLVEWTKRLRREAAGDFPGKVTAFHEGMSVHGCYGKPCPVCGAPVQRIVYAENETNYCARCQTNGKLLSDRALSRLLHKSWPRSVDELE